jgi:hypothetical protein
MFKYAIFPKIAGKPTVFQFWGSARTFGSVADLIPSFLESIDPFLSYQDRSYLNVRSVKLPKR